jgi:hypothetical protein
MLDKVNFLPGLGCISQRIMQTGIIMGFPTTLSMNLVSVLQSDCV